MIYDITPCPKPRMTRSDKWKKRPSVVRYWAFCDEVRLEKIQITPAGGRIIFYMPMPKSWSKIKKVKMIGKPHQQKPDIDNLLKAIFDAVFKDDSHIYDIRATKLWHTDGYIAIDEGWTLTKEIERGNVND